MTCGGSRPVLIYGEGRRRWDEIATAPSGPAGVVATACLEEEIERNTGSPRSGARDPNQTPARDSPGCGGCGEVRSSDEAG